MVVWNSSCFIFSITKPHTVRICGGTFADPTSGPSLELIPFMYWIMSGLGLACSYVIVVIYKFIEGYKNEKNKNISPKNS